MRFLLGFLITVGIQGCGDTTINDPQVKVGTTDPATTTTSTTTGEMKSQKKECEKEKICRGMSKDEVGKILPLPDSIERNGSDWIYTEQDGDEDVCFERYPVLYNDCMVSFDNDGKLKFQEDVSSKYLDVKNF